MTHHNVVLIPTKALLTDDSKQKVFIYKDGKAEQRSINLGISSPDGNLVEVTGLEPGDRVITSGLKSISDGQRVNAAEETSTKAKAYSDVKEGA